MSFSSAFGRQEFASGFPLMSALAASATHVLPSKVKDCSTCVGSLKNRRRIFTGPQPSPKATVAENCSYKTTDELISTSPVQNFLAFCENSRQRMINQTNSVCTVQAFRQLVGCSRAFVTHRLHTRIAVNRKRRGRCVPIIHTLSYCASRRFGKPHRDPVCQWQ